MNKQFIYILVILTIVLFIGFTAFYFLTKEEPRKMDIRPIPSREIKKVPLAIIQVKEIAPIVIEKRPDVRIQEVIPDIKVEGILTEELIFLDLKKEIEKVFVYAQNIKSQHEKKKKSSQIMKIIQSELKKMTFEHKGTKLFLVDYNGNILFGENSQEDINARTILLEEIQKVRRRGEGSIVSDVDTYGLKRYILVKSLNMYKLFVGVDRYERGIDK